MNTTQERINDITSAIKLRLQENKKNLEEKIAACDTSKLEINLTEKQENILSKTYKRNKAIVRKYVETNNNLLKLHDKEKLLAFLKDIRTILPKLICDVSLNFSASFDGITYFELELYKQEKDLVDAFISIVNKQKELNNQTQQSNKI